MRNKAFLDEARCWSVSGLRDPAAFFRALPQLLPDATHLFLEGSPAPDIEALLSPHEHEAAYGAPTGTLWSWPARNQRLAFKASSALFAELADAARQHATPEICDHVCIETPSRWRSGLTPSPIRYSCPRSFPSDGWRSSVW